MNKYNPDEMIAIAGGRLVPRSKVTARLIPNRYDHTAMALDGTVYHRDARGTLRVISKPKKGKKR